MPERKFKLAAEEIRPLATGLGSCFASDRMTVDGRPVGHMYREDPDNDLDSGWRFLAGDESDAYTANPENFALYDVNTVANYDQELLPFLQSPTGSAFARSTSDAPLRAVNFEPPEEPPERGLLTRLRGFFN